MYFSKRTRCFSNITLSRLKAVNTKYVYTLLYSIFIFIEFEVQKYTIRSNKVIRFVFTRHLLTLVEQVITYHNKLITLFYIGICYRHLYIKSPDSVLIGVRAFHHFK